MKDLELQEQLAEAEAYIERQKEHINRLEREKQWLYGKLNQISDIIEGARSYNPNK